MLFLLINAHALQAVDDILAGCDQSTSIASSVDVFTDGLRTLKASKASVLAQPVYAHLGAMFDQAIDVTETLHQAALASAENQVDKMRTNVSRVRDAALDSLLTSMGQIEFEDGAANSQDKKAWRLCNIAVLTCICEREQALAVMDERMDE